VIIIEFVKQPLESSLCGQACVAMIAGISLEKSIAIFGKRSSTTTKDVAVALRKIGFECADKVTRITKINEKPPLCMVVVRSKDNRNHNHWVAWNGKHYFDPALGICERLNGAYWNPIDNTAHEYTMEVHETSFLQVTFSNRLNKAVFYLRRRENENNPRRQHIGKNHKVYAV